MGGGRCGAGRPLHPVPSPGAAVPGPPLRPGRPRPQAPDGLECGRPCPVWRRGTGRSCGCAGPGRKRLVGGRCRGWVGAL
ncbi:hypothetical protein GTY47_07220 [Streptomyces sp. SID5464]|nr:hypothetical protein [Streptomyces sp. SID5464]